MKNYYCLIIFCFLFMGITTVNAQQPELTLWWITDANSHQGGQGHGHGNHSATFFPCDTSYYIYYDGQDQALTFSIKNEGDAPLNLALPLSLDHSELPNFTIIQQPDKAVLQPNEETHFIVQYDAGATYVNQEGTLAISSDDPNRSICNLNFGVGDSPLNEFLQDESFCATNLVLFRTDGSIKETATLTFDERNNRLTRVFTEFNSNGTPSSINRITNTYDANNNRLTLTEVNENPAGTPFIKNTTTNTYDGNNNLLTTVTISEFPVGTPSSKSTVTNTYDANNNLLTRIRISEFPVGTPSSKSTVTNTYDGNNNLLTSIVLNEKPIGTPSSKSTTTNMYDGNNNLLSKMQVFENPVGTSFFKSTITNMYDGNNNLLSSIAIIERPAGTPASKETITNTYDTNNNLLTQIEVFESPVGTPIRKETITNTYNANNSLLTKIEVFERPVGTLTFKETQTNTYDVNNNLLSSIEVDESPVGTPIRKETITNTYDANSNLLTRTNVYERPVGTVNSSESVTLTPCSDLMGAIDTKDINLNAVDPCSCEDPKNRTINGIFLFHDVLTVTSVPGRSIWLSANDGEFRDANNNPIPAGFLPTSDPGGNAGGTGTGTLIPETSTPGTYQLEFYHRENIASTISYTDGNTTQPFVTSSCATCTVIPTMSEWGLLIFGLLVMNLGLFFMKRQNIVLEN